MAGPHPEALQTPYKAGGLIAGAMPGYRLHFLSAYQGMRLAIVMSPSLYFYDAAHLLQVHTS